jgi:hypothetical protein
LAGNLSSVNNAGARYESMAEERIRDAQERGEFDNLPGAGEPLPGLDGPDDELWWVKGYMRREGLSSEPLLPTSLRLRKEVERLPATVAEVACERDVRETVAELNARIARWLRAPSGPHVALRPVAVDEVVERWRAERASCRGGHRARNA